MLDLLANIESRYHELSLKLGSPEVLKDPSRLREIGQEHRNLERIVEVGRKYRKTLSAIEEAENFVKDDGDADIAELAEGELARLIPEREKLEQELRGLLVPPDPLDDKGIILEIRAGTGGEEAALFAADLMRMYQRYSERQGWKIEALSSSAAGMGGLKEAAVAIHGSGVYGIMKHESGVHRVQRVPQTEASGRIHTSAASVAVLPEAEEVDIQIHENELKIDVFRSTGPGGQSVNTTDSAVRITHIPSGMVVTCQDEKSQHKNKAKALKVLRARLFAKAEEERQSKIAAERRGMVGKGDRSEKVRTYNFPQNRVTDHRIGLTLQKLEVILDGELDEVVEALREAEQNQRYAAWQDSSQVNPAG